MISFLKDPGHVLNIKALNFQHHVLVKVCALQVLYSYFIDLKDESFLKMKGFYVPFNSQGPISQRDLSPDLDLNLRLWS